YVGAYGAFRKAYVTMAQDEIAGLPKSAEKLLVLTRHGMPEIPGEPYPELARIYYDNLQKEVERVVAGTNTKVVFADTEFAAEDDDPDNERLSSAEAFEDGLEKKYAAIVFVLVDFMTENTDTVFCAREEAMEAIHFEYKGTVPYPDFTQPFRTDFMHDTTRVIVAGTPVGDRYRPMVSQGIYEAVTTVLKGKAWPQLIMKN
ncbi:MAG: hypothetical protein GY850_33655, partial [bacterium]|nr:hypothetical protein [bacterium]